MGKHAAVQYGGEVIAAQVRDEARRAFYADSSIWDHEMCGPGEACGSDCLYWEPDAIGDFYRPSSD